MKRYLEESRPFEGGNAGKVRNEMQGRIGLKQINKFVFLVAARLANITGLK
jgi:hypothetical protein